MCIWEMKDVVSKDCNILEPAMRTICVNWLHPQKTTLRATSHTRLKVHDHDNVRTLKIQSKNLFTSLTNTTHFKNFWAFPRNNHLLLIN